MSTRWTAHWVEQIGSNTHWIIERNGVEVVLLVTDSDVPQAYWIRLPGVSDRIRTPEMPYAATLAWVEQHQGESFPSRHG